MEGKMLYVYGKKGKYSTIKAKGAEPSMHLLREFGGSHNQLMVVVARDTWPAGSE